MDGVGVSSQAPRISCRVPVEFIGVDYYDPVRQNAIGWRSCTNNFFRGCSVVSEACKNCNAASEGLHQQRVHPGGPYVPLVKLVNGRPQWTGKVDLAGPDAWERPFSTLQPMLAFTNSMSDVFHDELSDEDILFFIRTLFRANWHIWQVLTKRHDRLASFMSRLLEHQGEPYLADSPVAWSQRADLPNLWMGVTAETQRRADERVPYLLQVKAAVRFISVEPMLTAVDVTSYLPQLDCVICGGESAEKFRPTDVTWVRSLRDQCRAHGVPFFFKQWAGKNPRFIPKVLDGETIRELPKRLLRAPPDRARLKSLGGWVISEYQAARDRRMSAACS